MTDESPNGFITETSEGVIIRLHLQPRASKTELCGIQGDELKVRVTAPPVDDAANRLCTDFFAKLFKTARTSVTIISGHKSRHKKILVNGIAGNHARNILLPIDKNEA